MLEVLRRVDDFLYDSTFGVQSIMWWLEYHFHITPRNVLWILSPACFAAWGYVVLTSYWESGFSAGTSFDLLFMVFLLWYMNHMYTISGTVSDARAMNSVRENPADLVLRFMWAILLPSDLIKLFQEFDFRSMFGVVFVIFMFVAGCSPLPPEKKMRAVKTHSSTA
jgi:hypothetical protein